LALSMVYDGAQGQTQTEMQKALQFQKLSLDEINQKSLELINTLNKTDSKSEISIANSVWIHQSVVVKPDFLNIVKNYYQAEISNLDFLDPYSVGVINDWVNTSTRGKIPTIINKIPPGVMMYLINAIYFKG
ncbi:MAG TPA: serpin family protein, partial [Candidatus Magasanikbacteria bacterium]|nr:serpin family protein [Candidatus Magasanikbacteria bacterium]